MTPSARITQLQFRLFDLGMVAILGGLVLLAIAVFLLHGSAAATAALLAFLVAGAGCSAVMLSAQLGFIAEDLRKTEGPEGEPA